MSIANNNKARWTQIAGVGLLCSFALAGCNRSEQVDQDELDNADEVIVVKDNAVSPVIACDNPLAQDRLKMALKSTLNQQAQSLAANYANTAQISIDANSVTSRVSGILINVQNAVLLQEANANGMTTCQASVSMTLPSEDLYQASQLQADNNQPSLQTRLAQANIRINNNMLVDDAFTYVVGTQGGQIRARITGQPTLVTLVSEVVAGSAVKLVVEEQRAERQAQQQAERRRQAAQTSSANRVERKPQAVTPLERTRPVQPVQPTRPVQPVRPVEPVKPATVNQGSSQNTSQSSAPVTPPTPKAPAVVPKDESIDMVIIEDESAIY